MTSSLGLLVQVALGIHRGIMQIHKFSESQTLIATYLHSCGWASMIKKNALSPTSATVQILAPVLCSVGRDRVPCPPRHPGSSSWKLSSLISGSARIGSSLLMTWGIADRRSWRTFSYAPSATWTRWPWFATSSFAPFPPTSGESSQPVANEYCKKAYHGRGIINPRSLKII